MSRAIEAQAHLRRGGTAVAGLKFRRAQPHLGTIVSISSEGLVEKDAAEIARLGFAAIATVHKLMSFHECGSDVDRANQHACKRTVEVDPLTMEVLKCAQRISALSDGAFDITVASELVARGVLPRPLGSTSGDSNCSWRDIELVSNTVRFHRPLLIDLGGIAKGFAVDHAFESIHVGTDVSLCISAGGDLRIKGPGTHAIRLQFQCDSDDIPVLALHEESSLASSSGTGGTQAHIHGRSRALMGERDFIAVLSKQCMVADALTKVAMALRSEAHELFCTLAAIGLICTDGECSSIGLSA